MCSECCDAEGQTLQRVLRQISVNVILNRIRVLANVNMQPVRTA